MPVAVIALFATSSAMAAQSTTTVTINHPITGTNNTRDARGTLRFVTPRGWVRTSARDAPTAKVTLAQRPGCSARIHVSSRAAASRQTSRARVLAATDGPANVVLIKAATRAGAGYWRLIGLPPGRKHANGADLYGLGSSVVAHHVLVDVRVFGFFSGCSTTEIRSGDTSRKVGALLSAATINARVVPRSG